jgi:hypothetical protein
MSLVAYILPRTFITFYFFIFTGALGFIRSDLLSPFSFEHFLFIANLATIFPTMMKSGFKFMSLGIIRIYSLFFLFGLFYPIYNGWSHLAASLTDGKDFISILLLPYLLTHRSITNSFIKALIMYISIYLGTLCLLYSIFNIFPTGYEPVGYLEDDGIHIRYSTIILISTLITYADLRDKFTTNQLILFIILFFFLIIQPHNSVALAAILIISIHYLYNLKLSYSMKLFDIGFATSASIGLLMIGFFPILQNMIYNLYIDITQLSGGLGSRISTNFFRYEYFLEEPIFGYGFINESSALGSPINDAALSNFTQTLGVVDSGIVDIAMRFGLTGLLFWLATILIALRNLGRDFLIFKLILTTFVIASLTWSVFTYSFGIVIISVAYALSVRLHSSKFMSNSAR